MLPIVQSADAEAADAAVVAPRGPLADVSMIVPIGPGESTWRGLLPELARVADEAELWFVATEPEPLELKSLVADLGIGCKVRWSTCDVGRARQMNAAASLATRDHLWFVHADSRLTADAIHALEAALSADADAVWYFDLEFQADGPALTRCNAWGVFLRSHWLKLPFGDQALCLRRSTFQELGGFDESAPYGEDHLLVWAARRRRVPIRCVDATISTSARKYAAKGWFRTTLLHVWRTLRQALPEWANLLWSRVRQT